MAKLSQLPNCDRKCYSSNGFAVGNNVPTKYQQYQ